MRDHLADLNRIRVTLTRRVDMKDIPYSISTISITSARPETQNPLKIKHKFSKSIKKGPEVL